VEIKTRPREPTAGREPSFSFFEKTWGSEETSDLAEKEKMGYF